MLKSNQEGFFSVLIVLVLVVIAISTCAVYLNNLKMMVLQKNDVLGVTYADKLEESSENLFIVGINTISEKFYTIFR